MQNITPMVQNVTPKSAIYHTYGAKYITTKVENITPNVQNYVLKANSKSNCRYRVEFCILDKIPQTHQWLYTTLAFCIWCMHGNENSRFQSRHKSSCLQNHRCDRRPLWAWNILTLNQESNSQPRRIYIGLYDYQIETFLSESCYIMIFYIWGYT